MSTPLGSDALKKFVAGVGKGVSVVATPVVDAIERSPVYAFALNSKDWVVDKSDSPGAAPLHAAWRAGLKDLQVAFGTMDGLQQNAREEPGSIAVPSSGIVTEQMKGKGEIDIDLDR